MLRLLEPFGYKSLNDDTELFYSEKEEVKINSILNNSMSRFKIGIAPSSAQFTKQWPKEYFKELKINE